MSPRSQALSVRICRSEGKDKLKKDPYDAFGDVIPPMKNDVMGEAEMKLHFVASFGDLAEIKELIESGVAINARDYNGRTALHQAAHHGHQDTIRLLISNGALLESIDVHGDTPLCLAQRGSHTEAEAALAHAGARPKRRNSEASSKESSNKARFAILQAFPPPIAVAILHGREIRDMSKGNVSIFFSDIVGFASIGSHVGARKMTDLLSTLIRKIDKLAYRHGVQKIDVIGDAYVAATNFMEDQAADHAARLARFAVDVMKAARETSIDDDNPDLFGCVQLRVGLHCGPVVGSVVGWQNFKYTLMGDSVNTASRMGSTGLAGRIQCSESIAELISEQAQEMILKSRSKGIDVKGKGHMQTYWLSSLRDGLCNFGSTPEMSRAKPRRGAHGLGESSQVFRI